MNALLVAVSRVARSEDGQDEDEGAKHLSIRYSGAAKDKRDPKAIQGLTEESSQEE